MVNYIELMNGYSALASWAIWESKREDGEFKKEEDLIEDVDFSKYRESLQKSNTIFLAMNPGGEFNEEKAKLATRKINDIKRPWNNFHNIGKSRDYLLAQAIKDTPEFGSYMTDIFPIVGSKSTGIKKFINSKENKKLVEKLILEFDDEVSLLFSNNKNKEVKLLCLGKDAFGWAKKFLFNPKTKLTVKNSYKIFYLPHYSAANNGGIKKWAEDLRVENYYPTVIKTLLEQYRN